MMAGMSNERKPTLVVVILLLALIAGLAEHVEARMVPPPMPKVVQLPRFQNMLTKSHSFITQKAATFLHRPASSAGTANAGNTALVRRASMQVAPIKSLVLSRTSTSSGTSSASSRASTSSSASAKVIESTMEGASRTPSIKNHGFLGRRAFEARWTDADGVQHRAVNLDSRYNPNAIFEKDAKGRWIGVHTQREMTLAEKMHFATAKWGRSAASGAIGVATAVPSAIGVISNLAGGKKPE